MNVTICDVGPRDGLQNEQKVLEPSVRAELVRRLAACGLKSIEAVSFVNPKRVPQMAGAEEVVERISQDGDVEYSGLVLNEKGYERLIASGLKTVHFAFVASDTFNGRNQNATAGESAEKAEKLIARSRSDGVKISVAIGAAFGCPFEGEIPPKRVLGFAERMVEAGADEIAFADTIGVGVPKQVRQLVGEAAGWGRPVGAHFHNTRNTGFANAIQAVASGASILDASAGGVGGCPFAPAATGNIATEDLVYLLHREGIETTVNLNAIISAAQWLGEVLGKELPGQLHRAGDFPAVSAA